VAGGVVRGGRLLAAVLFYGWQPEAKTLQVSVSHASPFWARASVLCGIFQYAFSQCGADLLHVGTPSTNATGRRFLSRVGFKQDGMLRHRYGRGVHAATFSMTTEEWRRSRWFVRGSDVK